jgi:hypothetical protein
MGFFCFNRNTLALAIVAICVIGALIFQQHMAALKTLSIMTELQQYNVVPKQSVQRVELVGPPAPLNMQRIFDPLMAPEKTYYSSDNRPPMLAMPPPALGAEAVNIRTRGEPSGYQKVGVIVQDGKHMPLYGQQTYPGSSSWNYFTNTDGGQFHTHKLPLSYKGRDCGDDNGCEEIRAGTTDSLQIPGYNNDGEKNVIIYRNSTPKYIPTLI